MTLYHFEIVVEKEVEDAGYLAYSPTLPGCFSNGKTIEEAKQNIREAIQQHIQTLLAHAQPIPQNAKLVRSLKRGRESLVGKGRRMTIPHEACLARPQMATGGLLAKCFIPQVWPWVAVQGGGRLWITWQCSQTVRQA